MNAVIFETVVTDEHQLNCNLPASLPTGCRLRVVIEPIMDEAPAEHEPTRTLTGDAVVDRYQPRTELGHKLIELRRAYVESGGKLMTWDEINAEVREHRGGVADD
ncbi:MAG: hypothetical protein DM484_09905 [Candidatus Methylumidiphilus alinenensis]|uniref:Uncharacterized protein n=1 Tax=Candidatus Methylumidiphilus alinenensis TaxID=2202197 RepID=A0A2W4RC13_9GAMM|nr:MAG: hypothetical protein DM484_09905 [Candidatus Methylumidiphilus alinenensis]